MGKRNREENQGRKVAKGERAGKVWMVYVYMLGGKTGSGAAVGLLSEKEEGRGKKLNKGRGGS